MKNRQNDINDDEIRIISSGHKPSTGRKRITGPAILLASVILIGVAVIILFSIGEKEEDILEKMHEHTSLAADIGNASSPSATETSVDTGYVARTDTLAGGVELSILTPVGAKPMLEIGNEALNDSTAVLIVQAADVREDNGEIVGTCVVNGELVSKGESKAGFCSIINGEVTLGVADATPMLEQALMNDGSFFRQYPLVVGRQIVENRPKGKSLRKALAEINGRLCVVIGRNKTTLGDFSRALTDVGATNAIYLVGGVAYCRYKDLDGDTVSFGTPWNDEIRNVNYIVWR